MRFRKYFDCAQLILSWPNYHECNKLQRKNIKVSLTELLSFF